MAHSPLSLKMNGMISSQIAADHDTTPRSFLQLPKEIRHRVWRELQNGLNEKRRVPWNQKPPFEFASLSLTCRQIHEELLEYFPQHIVPFAQYNDFILRMNHDVETGTQHKYRSLTIQFPLDVDRHRFGMLSLVLRHLWDSLEELNLSFFGRDRFEVETSLHGCCPYPQENGNEAALLPAGQRIKEMVSVMEELEGMQKLRVLVLSNMNMQIVAMVLMHMQRLEYLQVISDHRSQVHTNLPPRFQIAALAQPLFNLPVKVLNLSANAMLNASVLVKKFVLTLEHFTWTAPNGSFGLTRNSPHPYKITFDLLSCLGRNSKNLRTLRICLAERRTHGTNGAHQLGLLQAALKDALALMTGLRDLEIHLARPDFAPQYWDLGEFVFTSLPNNIERFYTNDTFLQPRHLRQIITSKYFCSINASSTQFNTQHHTISSEVQRSEAESDWSEYRSNVPEEEEIKMWIEPLSYIEEFWGEGEVLGTEITRSQATKHEDVSVEQNIIGEDLQRQDYIPMQNGELTFVSYHYRHPDHSGDTAETVESQTQMLLRLNGRLLDRARNKHLATFGPGQYNQSKLAAQYDTEASWTSESMGWRIMLYKLHECEVTEPRINAAREAMKSLLNSPWTDDEEYFGNEDEAVVVFDEESVARPGTLTPATYPHWIDVQKDNDSHWMCPEAVVPTIEEIADD